MAERSSTQDIIVATADALVLAVLISWGAVYGLNLYLGDEPPETTGAVHARPPVD